VIPFHHTSSFDGMAISHRKRGNTGNKNIFRRDEAKCRFGEATEIKYTQKWGDQ